MPIDTQQMILEFCTGYSELMFLHSISYLNYSRANNLDSDGRVIDPSKNNGKPDRRILSSSDRVRL